MHHKTKFLNILLFITAAIAVIIKFIYHLTNVFGNKIVIMQKISNGFLVFFFLILIIKFLNQKKNINNDH